MFDVIATALGGSALVLMYVIGYAKGRMDALESQRTSLRHMDGIIKRPISGRNIGL